MSSPASLPSSWGNFDLTGKTCVVTGGASGIGLAISELFAKKGGKVFVLDLNEADAAKAAKDIVAATGGSCTGLGCNVASVDEVSAAFATIGTPDVVVNNAGIAAVGTVLETTSEDMDRLYQVNIKGCYHIIQAAVRAMTKANRKGSIINLASIASKFGIKDRFAYSMSKAGHGLSLPVTKAPCCIACALCIRVFASRLRACVCGGPGRSTDDDVRHRHGP